MTSGSEPSGTRWPALDGLRAVGVVLVFLYHCGFLPFTGGRLGVDIFFPLSGFLITTIILREHRATGRFRFRRFYLRRATRLYPALAVVVVLTFFFRGAVTPPATLAAWSQSGAFALSYTTNFAVAFGARSTTAALTPTWSLALEEQFYLLWPVLLVVMLHYRWEVRRCALMAAVMTAGSWAVLARGATGAAFFRPDARAGGIMIGCVVGLLALGHPMPPPIARLVVPVAAALVVIAVVVATGLDHEALGNAFGIPATSLATAVMIPGLLALPGYALTRALAWRPVVWLGRRSYGFYLIHLPVLRVVALHSQDPVPTALIAAAVSLGLAAALFALVESPAQAWQAARGERKAKRELRAVGGRPSYEEEAHDEVHQHRIAAQDGRRPRRVGRSVDGVRHGRHAAADEPSLDHGRH